MVEHPRGDWKMHAQKTMSAGGGGVEEDGGLLRAFVPGLTMIHCEFTGSHLLYTPAGL